MQPRTRASLVLALFLFVAIPAAADVTATWRRLEPEGTPPPGRMATAHVFDAARDRLVVFGGYGHRNFYNDTWALELSPAPRWVQLPYAPVPGRHETTAIMDPASERMLVFGGKNQYGFFGDLLALQLDVDPPVWSVVAQGSPAPGARETRAVLDPDRRRFVTALGFAPYYHLGDSWAYDLDGGAWAPLAPTGAAPIPRRGQSAALDPSHDRMLVFGGSDDGHWWNEVWAYDLASPAWSLLDPAGEKPLPRYGQNLVFDPGRNRLVMFAGYGQVAREDSAGNVHLAGFDFLNDAWVLDLSDVTGLHWEKIQAIGDVPSKRDFFAMVWDPKRGRALVFGGNGGLDAETNDVWELTFAEELPSLGGPHGSTAGDLAVYGARARAGALEVSFRLHDSAPAKLEAFDAGGRRIASQEVGALGAGRHTASLARRDGSTPGLFWIRLTRGTESSVKKVALYP